jgi:hypothetical protein
MSRGVKIRAKYEVGDVLRYRSAHNGAIVRIIVTQKVSFDGFHGFYGILEQTREEVEGYDLNVESVVKRYK